MRSRGFFMIGVWHCKTECNIGTLFRSATCFGASGIFTVGKRYKQQSSDTTAAHKHIPLFHFADLDSLVSHLPFGCPLIGIELDETARSVAEYTHPQQACYLLGAEDHGLSDDTRRACHALIVVPGAERCLNVSVAGSIVMYDRWTKLSARCNRVSA